jgi:hypothetical protein
VHVDVLQSMELAKPRVEVPHFDFDTHFGMGALTRKHFGPGVE